MIRKLVLFGGTLFENHSIYLLSCEALCKLIAICCIFKIDLLLIILATN